MDALKKVIGVIAICLAFYAEYFLFTQNKVLVPDPNNNTVFVWTVIPVSLIAVMGALALFGYFAVTGEYDGSHEG
jgi:heme/copper-type cytochrome/quinol oxidase subunit 2